MSSKTLVCHQTFCTGSWFVFFFYLETGGFGGGGGGGGGALRPHSNPCRPKRSPFVLVCDIHFGNGPQKFSQGALSANIYKFWGGSARRKNSIFFWSKFSKKCLKSVFWLDLKKNCQRRRNIDQNRLFLVLWQCSENQFSRPKKCQQNVRNFFENPPTPTPPLEKILDPPLPWKELPFSQLWTKSKDFDQKIVFLSAFLPLNC